MWMVWLDRDGRLKDIRSGVSSVRGDKGDLLLLCGRWEEDDDDDRECKRFRGMISMVMEEG